MFRTALGLVIFLLLVACVKDREITVPKPPPGTVVLEPGVLKVNEFVATGSQNVNEFGSAEDWFEIYNPNDQDLLLEAGKWFVTDGGPSNPKKYELPEVTIPALGFLVIWCDNQNTVQEQIHTNFALSASGEHLLIHYDDGVQAFDVDDYAYPPQTVPAVSTGRFPDGADNWIVFQVPTPGAPNQ
jgi:hypothetical protein